MRSFGIRVFAATICASLLLVQSSASPRDGAAISAEIDEVLKKPEYRVAQFGILFVDLDGGRTVYELNADKLFKPASTTKLYSVATALDALGANHRFKTPVYRRGEVKDGTLHGDLILVASGDLNMGGRVDKDGHIAFKNHDHTYANGGDEGELTSPNPLAGLNDLAYQVAASGIKRLSGDVLIDDRLFDKATGTGSGPGRITPILINDNLIDVEITPGTAARDPATYTLRPKSAAWIVDVRVETVERGKPTDATIESPATGRLVVRGHIAVDHKPLVRVYEVDDASSFARSLFIEALQRAAIDVDASPLAANSVANLPDRKAIGGLKKVAELVSPPFSESIRLVLKVSHNLHAGTLPLLVATKHGKRTLEDGLHLQRDFLKRMNVDLDTVSFGSGAGGSPADYTTPRATVTLLRAMSKHRDFAAYDAGLPVLGVDGTSAEHAPSTDSPAIGKVHAKTGTYSSYDTLNSRGLLTSKALAGYMTTTKGHKLAFALFLNNAPLKADGDARKAGQTLGKLCEIVYKNE